MRLFQSLLVIGCSLTLARAEFPEAYFSGQDHIDQHISALIDHSRQTLDMALYEFSSRPLAQALARAAGRGVHIRLVLDPHIALEKKTVASLERIPALSIRYSRSRRGRQGHMHHKFLIVDAETMVTGSYNWTPGAEYVNYEDILIEKDAHLVTLYEQEFARLWHVGEEPSLPPLHRSSTV